MIKKIYNLILYKFMSPNNFAKKQGVKFGNNCYFRIKYFGTEPYLIKIGNNFSTSTNVRFITHDGSMQVLRKKNPELEEMDLVNPIIIGNNVFIGINSIILPGTRIEDNVIIGAGSIVKGKINKDSVYAGVPAKFICDINTYILKNSKNFQKTKKLNYYQKKEYFENLYREVLND